MGNERQRRAIDELQRQIIHWAVQDLRIKREGVAHIVQIEDPLIWLNHLVMRVIGDDLVLHVEDSFERPYTLICRSAHGCKVVFTPLSPTALRETIRFNRNRLAGVSETNPALTLPRGTRRHEISVLNGGTLFDLELPIAWKALTGHQDAQIDRLWLYILPK